MPSRPKTCDVPLTAIFALPSRICNPPPAVPKARSCGVVPQLQVRLDDILDRKHLPPLGLKDFEEWLLYVEMNAENLYFLLWLKEYTLLYNRWALQIRDERVAAAMEGVPLTMCSSTHLAMFYARAKETFLSRGCRYHLCLPSHYLAPFQNLSAHDSHPDPEAFTQVAIETRNKLEHSLQRFVSAQLHNVGNKRAICGTISGSLLFLIGAVPMIAATVKEGDSRWLRLALFPAIWLSTTVIISALHGICVGIYVFGDFRQLRKYELARPVAPDPDPDPEPQQLPSDNSSLVSQNIIMPPMPPALPAPVRYSSSNSLHRFPSITSVSSERGTTSSRYPCEPPTVILDMSSEISSVLDGGLPTLVGPSRHEAEGYTESIIDGCNESILYNTTASFIHPYEAREVPDPHDLNGPPEVHQRIDPFDFNALPPKLREPDTQRAGILPVAAITRLGALYSCSTGRSQDKVTRSASSSFRSSFPDLPSPSCPIDHPEKNVRSRFRKVMSVPAFAVPWTPVLSPVIRRGQWEIVTRSMCCAFLISWIVTGSLVAIPEHH
ncbi:hypothetical protein AX14_013956 [Amanita brunnescens Koide BX004]|nr:hypothetical protein AX14_013956 [Amanita brunnescens Koide BX004]